MESILLFYIAILTVVSIVLAGWALARTMSLDTRLRAMEKPEHRAAPSHERAAPGTAVATARAPEPVRHEPVRHEPARAPKSEFKIGASFYSMIGGIAVLLGLGFLLRYAIENNLISEGFRILLGLVLGAIVIGLGEWLRPKMKGYASILSGTGLGAWYISLYAASQLYALVPLEIAFIGMMVVTGLGIFLALRSNEQLLAAFAQIGGFLTPILLSSGENRPHVLFPFLIVLNGAMLIIAWKKPWRWLVGIGMMGTLLVYMPWYAEYGKTTPIMVTMSYLTILFLLFLGRTLYRAWTEAKADEMDFVLLFLAPLLYVFAGHVVLQELGEEWQSGLSFVLALLYFALAASRIAIHKTAKTYDVAFAGIGSVFLALTASTYFDTNQWIVASWGLEALALRFAARKIKSPSLVLLSQALFSITGLFAIFLGETASYLWALVPFLVLLGWNEWLVWKTNAARDMSDTWHMIATHVLALFFLGSEITNRWSGDLENSLITVSWLVDAIALTAYGIWRKDKLSRYLAVALFGLSTWKIVMVDTAQLDNFYRFVVFISLGLLLLLAGYLYNRFKGKIE